MDISELSELEGLEESEPKWNDFLFVLENKLDRINMVNELSLLHHPENQFVLKLVDSFEMNNLLIESETERLKCNKR